MTIIKSISKLVLAISLGLSAFNSFSQDIHFSQFNSAPANLNPALAGSFDGQYRFIGNHRRQWTAVSPDAVPYVTYGLAADANSFIKHGVGAGLSVYNDRDGWSKLNTLQVNLSGSYQFKINKDSTMLLAPGIQVGITQQSIDYSQLTFDNQYNGNYYDESLDFGESFSQSSHSYANINAGIAFIYKFAERKTIDAGFSLYNITRPRQSFMGDSDIRLDRRFNFHARVNFPITEKFDIIPSYLFMTQGKFREFDLGASLKYIMSNNKFNYQALYVGLWGRTKDAGYAMIGMDYNAWHVGVSYDINLSSLRPASNGRGGIELAIIYIVQPKPPKRLKYRMCPDYI